MAFDEFDKLSKRKGLDLKRLSYACANFDCINCDGKIHYLLRKEVSGFRDGEFHGPYKSAKTGEIMGEKEFETVDWDWQHESIQLEGGNIQNPENTPEDSTCECLLCHGRPGYDEWKARGGKIDMDKVKNQGKFAKKELSDSERENLK
jgi:hypothetical protein